MYNKGKVRAHSKDSKTQINLFSGKLKQSNEQINFSPNKFHIEPAVKTSREHPDEEKLALIENTTHLLEEGIATSTKKGRIVDFSKFKQDNQDNHLGKSYSFSNNFTKYKSLYMNTQRRRSNMITKAATSNVTSKKSNRHTELQPIRNSVMSNNNNKNSNLNHETSIDISPHKNAVSQCEIEKNETKHSKNSNIKVVVRFRPMNLIEVELIKNNIGYECVNVIDNKQVILKQELGRDERFMFDNLFYSNIAQEEIYKVVGKESLNDVFNGYNATIFAYGQSSSGKTYTMYGDNIHDDLKKGIVPRTIDDLFKAINETEEDILFQLKFSILQIYKEIVYDLLTGESYLKIKESPMKGVYVEGLTEVYVDSKEQFLDLISVALEERFVAGTKLNINSSRSHMIFILEVTQLIKSKNIQKKGSLYLVDLAGSEKVSKTGAVGETLEEAKKINLSLSALGNVINAITSSYDHIPFRDSKLTRILRESLGGNYKTSFIVTCSPHSSHFEESVSSLKFAQRVKTIKNKVKMNIKLSYDELQKTIDKLKIELNKAKKEIIYLKTYTNDDDKKGFELINEAININEEYDINAFVSKNASERILPHTDHYDKGQNRILCNNCSSRYFCNFNKEKTQIEELKESLKDLFKNVGEKNEKDENLFLKEKNLLNDVINSFETKMKEFELINEGKDNDIYDLTRRLKESEEKCKKLSDELNSYKNSQPDLKQISNTYEQIKENLSKIPKFDERILNNIKNVLDKNSKDISEIKKFIKSIYCSSNVKSLNKINSNDIEELIIDQEKVFKFTNFKELEMFLSSKDLKIHNQDKLIKKIKTYSNLMSNVLKSNEINDTTKNFSISLLLYLAILAYSYFTLNITILEDFNSYLMNENRIYFEENLTIFNYLEEILKINHELLQKTQNEDFIRGAYNNLLKKTINEGYDTRTSRITTSKVATYISKKNMNILKTITPKNHNKIVIDIDAMQKSTENENIESQQINGDISNTNESTRNREKLMNDGNPSQNNSFDNYKNVNNNKKYEINLDKLYSLKDFIIKSYQESQTFSNKLDQIKNEFRSIFLIEEDKIKHRLECFEKEKTFIPKTSIDLSADKKYETKGLNLNILPAASPGIKSKKKMTSKNLNNQQMKCKSKADFNQDFLISETEAFLTSKNVEINPSKEKENLKEKETHRVDTQTVNKSDKNKFKSKLILHKTSANMNYSKQQPQSLTSSLDQNIQKSNKIHKLTITKLMSGNIKLTKNKNLESLIDNHPEISTVRRIDTKKSDENKNILKNPQLTIHFDSVKVSSQQSEVIHNQAQTGIEEIKRKAATAFNSIKDRFDEISIEPNSEEVNQTKFKTNKNRTQPQKLPIHKKNSLSLNFEEEKINPLGLKIIFNDTDSESNDINNIETVISDYLEGGTATKKFDGVSFKVKNSNEIKVCFEGGLNATNKIKPPRHNQLEIKKGDLPID